MLKAAISWCILTLASNYVFALEPISRKESEGIVFEKFMDFQTITMQIFSLQLPNSWVVEGGSGTLLASRKSGNNDIERIIINFEKSDLEYYSNFSKNFLQFQSDNKKTKFINFRIESSNKYCTQSLFLHSITIQPYDSSTTQCVYSEVATEKMKDVIIEKQEIETNWEDPNKKQNKVFGCTFVNQYYYKNNYLDIFALLQGSCKDTRLEFKKIENSFVWKN